MVMTAADTFREITASRRQRMIARDPRISGKTCFSLDAFRVWLRDRQTARDIWKCRYCGQLLTIQEMEIDHWESLGLGGVTALSNLAESCRRCNKAKGKLCGPQFIALLEVLEQFPRAMRDDVFARLAAGPQWRGKGGGKSAAQQILDSARDRGLFAR